MTTLSNIKNIIFDLGGVILNIDPKKTLDELYKIGVPKVDNLKALLGPGSPPTLYEIGAISSDEFRRWIKEQAGRNISDELVDKAWTAMLLDVPVHRVEFLRQLSKEYRLFLFSNTNEIHQRHYEQKFKQHYHFQIADLFEKVYYSHIIGLRKPEPEGFLHI
ncbi:MAG: HAD family phosphatase, partial [Bacteroidota bacterium]|nr:HAD family phosphatase [Bacteroidota bacterium]